MEASFFTQVLLPASLALIMFGMGLSLTVDDFTVLPKEPFSLIKTSLSLLIITLFPILIGMSVRHYALDFARRSEGVFRHISTLFLFTMITLIAIDEQEMLLASFPNVFALTFGLNILATVIGVMLARIGNLSDKDAVTLGIEVGTQNATMSILISVTFLQHSEYAIASGVYGVTMYLGAFLLIMSRKLGWFGFTPKVA